MCRATNEIGTQESPCIFHVMPAGKPDPVYNCSESNQSYSTMSVTCKKGFNGGLKQVWGTHPYFVSILLDFVLTIFFSIEDLFLVNLFTGFQSVSSRFKYRKICYE